MIFVIRIAASAEASEFGWFSSRKVTVTFWVLFWEGDRVSGTNGFGYDTAVTFSMVLEVILVDTDRVFRFGFRTGQRIFRRRSSHP